MSVTEDRRSDPHQHEAPHHEQVYALVAATCAMLAGGIHLAVAPGHWDAARPMGVFFLVVGVAQLCLGGALGWRMPPSVLVGAIGAHVVVMGLYVASRTVDLPFVPPHDEGHEVAHLPVAGGNGNGIPVYPGSRIEPVGLLDVTCLLAELVLVAMLAGLLPQRWRGVVTSSMVGLGLLAAAARVVAVLG